MSNVPMMNTFCRRCHAAILSTAHSCPQCGLSKPNYANLSEIEKHYIKNPPSIPYRFESMVYSVDPHKGLLFQLGGLWAKYLTNPETNPPQKLAWGVIGISLLLFALAAFSGIIFVKHVGICLAILAGTFLIFDAFCFIRAAYSSYMLSHVQKQGGTSPYSVHFKIEAVLQHSLESLQTLLYTFYEKPWETMAQQMDITLAGDTFVQAVKAITAKIKKFANISLETITLLWRNNVYAITAYSHITYEEKITNLHLKIREAEAIIIRYCWLRQLSFAHEFLESHLNGQSGRTTAEDGKFVIGGMQLDKMGPLREPFYGNFETVPYELPFIMRFFWHQQLRPDSLPAEEIIAQYPETAELFESIGQVKNLIVKLEEQKLINSATAAVARSSNLESDITSEAGQIKRFQMYSEYLDIPKFQPDESELLRHVDRLNAQIKI